jgi:threonine/homoserine/homoserine lactone efflux protein
MIASSSWQRSPIRRCRSSSRACYPFGASFAALALHGAIFAALTLGWLVGVARADAVLRLPRVRRVLDLCTAAVLVGFGLHLAVERR